MTRNYWWVSQNTNHAIAMAQGTLWTSPDTQGRTNESKRLIHDIREGDIVFHHADRCLRAVSQVTAAARPYPRPDGYPSRTNRSDQGWLVRVERLHEHLAIPYQQVSELIGYQARGPLGKDGRPAQGKYISPLTAPQAQALLENLNIDLAKANPLIFARMAQRSDTPSEVGATDALAVGTIRREQQGLRQHLLQERLSAPCALCGHHLPASLLVAAHIKPRHRCSEDQRHDFDNVAMLACTLGCDALFEQGYVVVDQHGIICRGRMAETPALAQAVNPLIGIACGSHTPGRASYFADHRRVVLGH